MLLLFWCVLPHIYQDAWVWGGGRIRMVREFGFDFRSLTRSPLWIKASAERLNSGKQVVRVKYNPFSPTSLCWSLCCSDSPSHSLPRSASNVEGRSVPATPLLARTAPISVHVRYPQPCAFYFNVNATITSELDTLEARCGSVGERSSQGCNQG